MSAIAVIYAIRPKPGEKDRVREIFSRHLPALRAAGLVTDCKPLFLWSPTDNVFIESFEWKSVEHSRQAESLPEILAIWGEFAKCGDFVPLASLTETTNQFAHFQPV